MTKHTLRLTRAGVTAALYFVLTVAVAPIAYGPVQFRISEALCVLPLFFPECAIGLTIGCFFANVLGNGVLDMTLGTLATLLAGACTALCGRIGKPAIKIIAAEIPPILLNAFIVPFTFLAATDTAGVYFMGVLSVGAGQLTVIATLGTMLAIALQKYVNRKTAQ